MPDILGVRGEGELGVSAVVLQGGEVDLQQAAGLEVGVASVCAGLAAPDLLHHVLVQSVRVAVVGDVEEHVDLLDVLHSAVKRSIGSTTGCTITEKAPTRAFS